MIATAPCPFCPCHTDGASWEVEDCPATYTDDGYTVITLLEMCDHARRMESLFNAMESYALDGQTAPLHKWEEEALANATALGIPVESPVNVAATEAGMKA